LIFFILDSQGNSCYRSLIPDTGLFAASENDHDIDNYDVKFYFLDIEVSDTTTWLTGSTTILIEILDNNTDSIVFDMSDSLFTDSVHIDDHAVSFGRSDNQIIVYPWRKTEQGSKLKVKIYYHGTGQGSGWLSGIYSRYVAAYDLNVTWTLSEPFSAKNWFPCKQVLTDKADSAYIFLTIDSTLKAGSNGLLTGISKLNDNKVRYEWKTYYPIAYYLISFTVSDYLEYSFYIPEESGDSIFFQNYIYNDSVYLEQNIEKIHRTSDIMQLFSNLFGPYPFREEKYGHCIAPIGGGMEHQTMTTQVNFSFMLTAHELSHQWFGDQVTCATWQDIWINEGFASYCEYLTNQYLESRKAAHIWMIQAMDFVKSVPDGSIYLPHEEKENVNRIFDNRLSYKKGAVFIHMIRQELDNDTLFFSVLKNFQLDFANGNATGPDFKNYLEQQTGRDFTIFFDQWYFGEGYPILNINWEQQNDTLTIYTLQTTSVPDITDHFNILIDYAITGFDNDSVIRFRMESNYSENKIYYPHPVSSIRIDPDYWLLAEVESIKNINDTTLPDKLFTVFPNPAKNNINISFKEVRQTYNIVLTDISGKIFRIIEHSGELLTVDISPYPQGIYIILINNDHSMHPAKFIKI